MGIIVVSCKIRKKYRCIRIYERKNNRVYFDPESTVGIIYGEKDGKSSEKTKAIERLFEGTGLHCRESDVILSEIWSKFRLNVGNNQPQAMLGVGVGAYENIT